MSIEMSLTPQAQKEIEEKWELERRAYQILRIVVAEWQTDPTSVQCFDLRIVEEAERLIARKDKLDKKYEYW